MPIEHTILLVTKLGLLVASLSRLFVLDRLFRDHGNCRIQMSPTRHTESHYLTKKAHIVLTHLHDQNPYVHEYICTSLTHNWQTLLPIGKMQIHFNWIKFN